MKESRRKHLAMKIKKTESDVCGRWKVIEELFHREEHPVKGNVVENRKMFDMFRFFVELDHSDHH